MNEAERQAQQARILEEAAAWLEKMERTLRSDEAKSLRAWLKNKTHREAIVDRCKRYHGPEILAVLGELVPLESLGDRVERNYNQLLVLISVVVTGIATFTILIAIGRSMPTRDAHGNPLRAHEFVRTLVGEQKTIKFPDGGSVRLNTLSAVFFRFDPSSRRATLRAGEAAFHVKYDPARPFTVFASGRRFDVLDGDARFNLRTVSPELAELMVIEGKLRVHNARLGRLEPAQLRTGVRVGEYTFGGSEGGTIGPGWQSAYELSAAEIERRLAWQSGLIRIEDESLENALREVERYTPSRFEFAEADLKAVRITATFTIRDVEGVRRYLKEELHIHSEQTDTGKIVLRRTASTGTEAAAGICVANYPCRRLTSPANVRF